MIVTAPGVAFEALALAAPTGLTGEITVEVYDPTDATVILAETTEGIAETNEGTYRVILTVEVEGTFMVRWTLPTLETAEEELTVDLATGEESETLEAIRPSLQMVADLVRTRIVHEGGDMDPTRVDTFDSNTYPTAAQASRLIDQATNAIFVQLPGSVSDAWAPAGQHLAALYSAILIEGSYFREQLTDDQVALYRDLLASGIRGLGTQTGGAGESASTEVDTVMMRSIMTTPLEQQWLLDLPEVSG